MSTRGRPSTISCQNLNAPDDSAQGSHRYPEFSLRDLPESPKCEAIQNIMFSHVVIFWTDPAMPSAAHELIDGANKYLKPIPGVTHFHVGKMVPSHRTVVDQTYQVGLNIIFQDKKTKDDYQLHPLHVEFIEKVFKRVCTRVVVYDFQTAD